MTHSIRLSITVIAALSLGCERPKAGNSANAPSVAVRDSQAIEVVENTSYSDGENGYSIDTVLLFDAGGSPNGEDAFRQSRANPWDPNFRPFPMWKMNNGNVVLAYVHDNAIRLYDSTGRLIKRIGRQGNGPGEFQFIFSSTLLPGDTLLAYDVSHRRFSWLSPEGNLVREKTWEFSAQKQGSELTPFAWLADGTVVLRNYRMSISTRGPTGIIRDTGWFAMTGPDGKTTPKQPYPYLSHVLAPGNLVIGEPIYGPAGIVVAWDSLLIVGDNASYSFDAYDRTGKLVRRVRMKHTPKPVTTADIRSILESVAEDEGFNSTRRGKWIADQLSFPRHSHQPAYDRILVADNGEVWVRDYDLFFDKIHQSRYTVFDQRGRAKTTVRAPVGFDVQAIAGDRVLGTWLDTNDVLHVQAFRLKRGK